MSFVYCVVSSAYYIFVSTVYCLLNYSPCLLCIVYCLAFAKLLNVDYVLFIELFTMSFVYCVLSGVC